MARQAYIVTDISFGDAGKGTTVDYLVRQAESAVVVRYNGGPQAAHNVMTPDGRHHTFAQFGSGSFVPGVQTHLSRFILVNPLNMMREAEHLVELGVTDIWQRTTIDAEALVILPWHQAANQLRELARGEARHGSCGQGVGEAQSDALRDPRSAIRVKDLLDTERLRILLANQQRAKLEQLRTELGTAVGTERDWEILTDFQAAMWAWVECRNWCAMAQIVSGDHLATLAETHEQLVFEGAQGVLLDESYGFHPYTTWSNTTPANALTLLEEIGYDAPVTRLGVMRAYTTRHGAGPFVTEDPELNVPLRELHNDTGQWQGAFRYGHLDLLAHRYAIAACGGLDALVVTGLDRISALPDVRYCTEYNLSSAPTDAANYFERVGSDRVTGIRVSPTPDLVYQARLTELLSTCSPVYQTVSAPSGTPDPARDILRATEDHLGLPVQLASYGPTAIDKRALIAC